jgi:RHS repeat-associated protein
VLAVVSDKRIVVGCTTYAAELHQATDYYPFGAPMAGRSLSLENNPAAQTFKDETGIPRYFKRKDHYTIDGRKELMLFYPSVASAPFARLRYAVNCTTRVSPLTVVTYFLESTADQPGVRAYVAHINASPGGATAAYSLQSIEGVLYDVVTITFGPALAGVAYKDISFTGGTGRLPSAGPPFHVFVSPGDDYRYGFNGKEDDPEISWQDYGERMYDPRVARFPSSDPLIVYGQRYVSLSPYQFAGLNPIQFIDLDGLEPANPPTQGGETAEAPDRSENRSGLLGRLFRSQNIYTWAATNRGAGPTWYRTAGVQIRPSVFSRIGSNVGRLFKKAKDDVAVGLEGVATRAKEDANTIYESPAFPAVAKVSFSGGVGFYTFRYEAAYNVSWILKGPDRHYFPYISQETANASSTGIDVSGVISGGFDFFTGNTANIYISDYAGGAGESFEVGIGKYNIEVSQSEVDPNTGARYRGISLGVGKGKSVNPFRLPKGPDMTSSKTNEELLGRSDKLLMKWLYE